MNRPPALPDRDSIPESDRTGYDYVYQRISKLTGRPPDGIPFVCACLNSPPLAEAFFKFSSRMLATFSTSEALSHKERDYINVVLSFDSGYYSQETIGGHLPHAVEYLGMRPEMARAIWEDRTTDLTDDERQLVEYIRAYVAGTVTPEMWAGIVERFGSDRVAVEYTMTIGYVQFCMRSMQAFGVPSLSREQMQQIIDDLGPGNEEHRTLTAGLDESLRDPAFVAEMAG